ncbi:hypothetical protein ASPWEDRAFT_682872 [Aspergillus wentii DTO 134E9]|uniref:Phytanoyl-CoA dioxygenase n=1 Tax=Aspergillus wentii DTO 134E9 TaxID=1073089 RepID=A0A1L9R864_ASPWE|nr:uncharacterized protein ASPWEDRAFT_682872 [Aspergillus wentii DTO 134E9]KAI9924950.1 hypothetical protein MW887_006357 [Aspergillus wentii]OJJ31115.1 hypothetical protein ASPWEDRAFT_682872 [Aspergillus wentii DTO 134E9]
MNGVNGHQKAVPNRLFASTAPQLDDFKKICSQTTNTSTYPLAASIERNIPIYDASALDVSSPDAVQNEWHHALASGPGVFVLKNMYNTVQYDTILASTDAAFQRIIKHEQQITGAVKGDHFAAGGRNNRIWNSFSKHALDDPASFVEYYSNPWLRLVSETWLGPAYRVTAQVNIVKPGGAAQDSHRDYHLGFQVEDSCSKFPAAMQIASQYLTLQGAVAHSDMPLASGPTRFLPFSQTYPPGYLAYRREEFRAYFQENYVALPLSLGDGVFFNPALFHAAGANETALEDDFHRKANLLQISSAFGKPMETVETVPLINACWDVMRERYRTAGGLDGGLGDFVKAVAEGYPFPTNLDRRPPAPSGMAPESEQEIVMRGLEGGWERERVVEELERMIRDSKA